MGLVGGKDRLVYGNKTSNTIVVYDPELKTVVAKSTTLSTPTDSVLTADKGKAFITCKGADRVAVVDLASGQILTHVLVGRKLDDMPTSPVHIYRVPSPDPAAADQIWVMGDGDASVTVIDAISYKVLHVIEVGVGHHKAAFTATRAFVSNMTDSTISVIDRTQVK
jgi:DNA-binding beta-propeller fold protein YncE